VYVRRFGGEILGDAVSEIVLGRIVGEVGERQHDDGEMRGLGGRVRRGRRGAVPGEVPCAGPDQNEQRRDP
jgi:hypothetical protein